MPHSAICSHSPGQPRAFRHEQACFTGQVMVIAGVVPRNASLEVPVMTESMGMGDTGRPRNSQPGAPREIQVEGAATSRSFAKGIPIGDGIGALRCGRPLGRPMRRGRLPPACPRQGSGYRRWDRRARQRELRPRKTGNPHPLYARLYHAHDHGSIPGTSRTPRTPRSHNGGNRRASSLPPYSMTSMRLPAVFVFEGKPILDFP